MHKSNRFWWNWNIHVYIFLNCLIKRNICFFAWNIAYFNIYFFTSIFSVWTGGNYLLSINDYRHLRGLYYQLNLMTIDFKCLYINSEAIRVSFAFFFFFFSLLFLESSPEFFKGHVFGLENICSILKVTEVQHQKKSKVHIAQACSMSESKIPR